MKKLERTAVIIDLNQVGELDNAYQLYERIRTRLNREFGAATTQEVGAFSPSLAQDLRDGKFIRISDWKTPPAYCAWAFHAVWTALSESKRSTLNPSRCPAMFPGA